MIKNTNRNKCNILSESLEYDYNSYMVNILESMTCRAKRMTRNKINLYKKIKSGIVHEAFSDYYTQSYDLVKEFVDFVDDKINDFITYMEDFIASDKRISSYKDKLTKGLKSYEDQGTRPGFEYTIVDKVPSVNALNRFNENLFVSAIDSKTDNLSTDYLRNNISNTELESDYRKFRGLLLNTSEEYSMLEFNKELQKVFRNNTLIEKDKLKIDTDKAKEIVHVWFNFKEFSSSLYSQFKSFVSVLNSILDKISKCVNINQQSALDTLTAVLPGDVNVDYIDGINSDNYPKYMSAELQAQVDMYCKIKLDQLQTYTDYICLAFSAKMDAIKDMYQQYRLNLLDMCDAIEDGKDEEYKDGLERLDGDE